MRRPILALLAQLAAILAAALAGPFAGSEPSAAAEPSRQPVAAEGYTLERLVPGSGFHTLNGLALLPDGRILLASLSSESIVRFDPRTGAIDTLVGPPSGHADDVALGPDGSVYWTAVIEGVVRRRTPDGRISEIARGLPRINSLAFSPDGRRLLAGQVSGGDGLWDVDPEGARPARRLMTVEGGLNAFTIGRDGAVYGPSWERGEVVRLDPDAGTTTILARGLGKPGAVRIDSRGRLFALDDATGTVHRVDAGTGAALPVVRLAPATDNMIVTSDDHLLVTNMADNSVTDVDPDAGTARTLVRGALAFPREVVAVQEDGRTVLYVADTTVIRRVDGETGAVRDVVRRLDADLRLPTSISLHGDHLVATGELLGAVQVIDRATGRILRTLSDFDRPGDAVELDDGSLVVSEPGRGRLLRVHGERRDLLADGLDRPTRLVAAGEAGDGGLLVAESGAGALLRVDPATGRVARVAGDLGRFRSFAVLRDGAVAVLDVGEGCVRVIGADGRAARVIARDLPVGTLSRPHPRSGGIAAAPDGTIYVAADVENALYRLSPPTAPAAR